MTKYRTTIVIDWDRNEGDANCDDDHVADVIGSAMVSTVGKGLTDRNIKVVSAHTKFSSEVVHVL